MKTIKEKNDKIFKTMSATHSYKNAMQAPRLVKVIVSSGVGSFKDKKKIDIVEDRLTKITGQKPVKKGAKISIAAFKVREGDPVGFQVTLRGKRMYDFLDKLVNIALPRTKDFRGVSSKAIDAMGNYTLGIREHAIFPETTDEELKDIFGMAITVVTTAKTKEEAKTFFEHLGFPFKKIEMEEKVERVAKEKKVAKKAKS